MASFSNRLKEIRESKGLRQSDLAELLKVGSAAVSKWEMGRSRPDLDYIKEIAEIFNVSCDYLLGASDIPNRAINENVALNDDEIALASMYKKLPSNYQYEVKGYINGILSLLKQTPPAQLNH